MGSLLFGKDDFLGWLAPGSPAFQPIPQPSRGQSLSEKELNIWVGRRESTQRSWGWLFLESLLCVHVGGMESSFLHKAAQLLGEEDQARTQIMAPTQFPPLRTSEVNAVADWQADLRQMRTWLKEGVLSWGHEVELWETIGFEGPLLPGRSWSSPVSVGFRKETVVKARARFARLIPVVESCLAADNWTALVIDGNDESSLLSNRHRPFTIELLGSLREWGWTLNGPKLRDEQVQKLANLALGKTDQFRFRMLNDLLKDEPRWMPAVARASLAEWTPQTPSEELQLSMSSGANWFRKRVQVWNTFASFLDPIVLAKKGQIMRHGALDFAMVSVSNEGKILGSGRNKRRSILLNAVCLLAAKVDQTLGEANALLSEEGWMGAWKAHAASAEPSATRHAALMQYAPGLQFAELRGIALSKIKPQLWAQVENELLRADLGSLLRKENQDQGLDEDESPEPVPPKPRKAMRL